MLKPFIRNHQYNLIKKQTDLLQRACNTVTDPKVVESVRYSALTKIVEAFPDAEEAQKQALEKISTLHSTVEFQDYLESLVPYMAEFAPVTEKQIRKLFPKIKKLKVPDAAAIDFRYVTYVGWTDIATNRMFFVYHLNGKLVGIEGRYTPTNKKSICFLCHRHEEVALFSAVTKSKPANASPDYYKAIGNYVCLDSDACNKNITNVGTLEKFIGNVLG
ncbi:MAG: FusB/FusC family EF-G-binding protein [Paenibacillus dendritiformis]|uniref:FusB/FusC family EF-G-binding protein n=1 Tax=uncultured Paenibacillus sp. TaxID=227322 RepID=UPI0025D84206|nr:FusB/FusC family EF-G-binding protein [uncultured Paenibacillus sp.]MDU5144229.1 FusB/FusC family EF-G-binding protein [Paenibacillus dendritiformis]